jgi:hypothetical protein
MGRDSGETYIASRVVPEHRRRGIARRLVAGIQRTPQPAKSPVAAPPYFQHIICGEGPVRTDSSLERRVLELAVPRRIYSSRIRPTVGVVFGWLIRNQSAENIARLCFARRLQSHFPLSSPDALSAVKARYRSLPRVKCLRAAASIPTAALLGVSTHADQARDRME